jgi:hypothetical protein
LLKFFLKTKNQWINVFNLLGASGDFNYSFQESKF